MMYSSDSTSINYLMDRDKYLSVQKEIDSWRVSRRKGQINIFFDGSGKVVRFTLTTEGK